MGMTIPKWILKQYELDKLTVFPLGLNIKQYLCKRTLNIAKARYFEYVPPDSTVQLFTVSTQCIYVTRNSYKKQRSFLYATL
jgi:hypothetical protein